MADIGKLLPSKVAFVHKDYDLVEASAIADFDGHILIYFFDSGSEAHKGIVKHGFGYQPAADFINEYFACMAVDKSSEEGLAFFKSMVPYAEYKVEQTNFLQYIDAKTGAKAEECFSINAQSDEAHILTWLSGIKRFLDRELRQQVRDYVSATGMSNSSVVAINGNNIAGLNKITEAITHGKKIKTGPPPVINSIGGDGVIIDSAIQFNHIEYKDAAQEAIELYDGYLFICFFEPESDYAEAVINNGFVSTDFMDFVNSKCARIAVDLTSEAGMKLVLNFKKRAHLWPHLPEHVVLMNVNSGFRSEFFGMPNEDLVSRIRDAYEMAKRFIDS